jgi:hypothetical protein
MRRLTNVATIPVRSARKAAIVTAVCPAASSPARDPIGIHSKAMAASYAVAARRTRTTVHPMEAPFEMTASVRGPSE